MKTSVFLILILGIGLWRVPGLKAERDAGDELRVAVTTGDIGRVRALIAAGAPVDAPQEHSGISTVLIAVHGGQPEMLRVLLAAGGNPSRPTEAGTTPLMAAALAPNHAREMTVDLLRHGADPLPHTRRGMTALMMARQANRADVAALLERAEHQVASLTSP